MNITAKSKYAVRALVELAHRASDTPVPLVVIAEAREIPTQFLEQLFATLRRAGILQSHRGVYGGFSFNRSPDQVSVLDVVEALDGPIEPGLIHARGRRNFLARGVAIDQGRSIVHSLGQMGLTAKGLVFSRLRSLFGYLLLSPAFFFSH